MFTGNCIVSNDVERRSEGRTKERAGILNTHFVEVTGVQAHKNNTAHETEESRQENAILKCLLLWVSTKKRNSGTLV